MHQNWEAGIQACLTWIMTKMLKIFQVSYYISGGLVASWTF